jgi:N-acetylglucosamine kinase-like BadF-type ATPase
MKIVVDLGQSGARVKIGEEISTHSIAKNSAESVSQTLEKIFQLIPQNQYESAYLSLTGLFGKVGDVAEYGALCNKYFQSSEVFVMDDGLAAYVGAIGEKNGVVLTLGGGVVAVSGKQGNFGHADGKGSIFGDLGGGFWVGQAGIRRAIATLDGRDTADDLLSLMTGELAQYEALANKSGVDAAALCISSAATVANAAESGSQSAREVLQEGAKHLARTVRAAWFKVNSDPLVTPTLAFLGGLSKSKMYVELIKAEISTVQKCEFVEAAGDHLSGAPAVAELYPTGISPLLKVWRA